MSKPTGFWGTSHGKNMFGPEAGPAQKPPPPRHVVELVRDTPKSKPKGGPPDRSESSKKKAKASLARLKKTNDAWRANRYRKPGIGA